MNKKTLSEIFTIFPVEGCEDKAPKILRDKDGLPLLKKDGDPKRFYWPKVKNKKLPLSVVEQTDTFGVCCGVDGLEVIDIDNYDGLSDEYYKFVSDNIDLSKYLCLKTQHGGYHIYYRCNNPGGAKKLARGVVNGKNKTLLETRGKDSYVVFYDNIINGSIETVPFIDDEEREDLLSICISLNKIDPTPEQPVKEKYNNNTDGPSPGDLYLNDPATIEETKTLLINEGWTSSGSFGWIRPGKKRGIGATFGRIGVNKFYVFSDNGDPFPIRESMSMFKVRAILLHNDDMKACAKELADRYGLSYTKSSYNTKNENKKTTAVKRGQEDSKRKTKHDVLRDILKERNISVRYNDIHKRYEFTDNKKWSTDTDFMTGRIANEMEDNRHVVNAKGEKKPISISPTKVFDMIKSESIGMLYNPVNNFFKNIPKWDGVDYFKKLMKYIEITGDEDKEFFTIMLKKHLIRACKCALIENYVNRFVLVFHGTQEIGKSKFWQWIIPDELYYDDPIDPSDKDCILALSRYMIVNIDELDGLRRDEVAKLKAFISRGIITKRLSYGKNDNKFERRASIVASTNESEILIDTSNTRWLILKTKGFDWKGYLKNIKPINLWSQAMAELKKDKEAGELTKEEKEKREIRNSKEFLETTAEAELLVKHFFDGGQKYSSTEVFDALQKKYYSVKLNQAKLRRELHRMFGKPHNTRKDGNSGRYFYLDTKDIDIDVEPVNFNDYINSESREIKTDAVQDEIPF